MSNHIKRERGSSTGKSAHIQRDRNNPTRYYSTKQENTVAKELGGTRTKNSGATDFGGKSDVSIESLFNIECKTKTTSCNSISIKKEWIEKNAKEALFDGRPYSAIAFNFGPGEDNFYIIDRHLFESLIEYLSTKEDN